MPDIKPTILVIEDEEALQRFLRATLGTQGYRVQEARTGELALRMIAGELPDMIILDLGLPDIDGVEITRRLRQWTAVPIIVVSARGREEDKVTALDAGADDYLTKPFSVPELLARVRVTLRHLSAVKPDTGESVFKVRELMVDLARREVSVNGVTVHLTPNEFKLLTVLVKHAGRVLTHKQLLKDVWGPDSVNEAHYLRVYMNQLRQKLETDATRPQFLLTEPGVGYRLAAE
jgi:two-component system KDP operon response regulator KdpE